MKPTHKQMIALALLLLSGCGDKDRHVIHDGEILTHSAIQIYPEADGTFTVEVIASRRPWVPVIGAWHTSRSNAEMTFASITNQLRGASAK